MVRFECGAIGGAERVRELGLRVGLVVAEGGGGEVEAARRRLGDSC